MRIIHIADTHCRNLKYHQEYYEVFTKIFAKIRELKPDLIVHCGDICHTKTNMSPELIDIVSDFLGGLADISPTIVIPGNHDGNQKNSTRQDALTPIINALEHENLLYFKNSTEYTFEDITFNILSTFDNDRVNISDDNNINIALFHGTVKGSETELGWVLERGECDLEILKLFDYAPRS